MKSRHSIHALLHGYFSRSFPYFRALHVYYECCHLVVLYCARIVHKGPTLVVIKCEERYLDIKKWSVLRSRVRWTLTQQMVEGDGVLFNIRETIASVSGALSWAIGDDFHIIWRMLKWFISLRKSHGTSHQHEKANLTSVVTMTAGICLIHSHTKGFIFYS
jgi:hypothetical protein